MRRVGRNDLAMLGSRKLMAEEDEDGRLVREGFETMPIVLR